MLVGLIIGLMLLPSIVEVAGGVDDAPVKLLLDWLPFVYLSIVIFAVGMMFRTFYDDDDDEDEVDDEVVVQEWSSLEPRRFNFFGYEKE